MKLLNLFTRVPIAEFSDHLQPELQALLTELQEALAYPPGKKSEEIVSDLASAYNRSHYRVLQFFRVHAVKSEHCKNLLLSSAFQAAWLMDGGKLGAFDEVLGTKLDTESYPWRGAHYLLFDLAFKQVPLALEGVCHLLHHVYDQREYTHGLTADQPLYTTLSLHGFLESPDFAPSSPGSGSRLHGNSFFSGKRLRFGYLSQQGFPKDLSNAGMDLYANSLFSAGKTGAGLTPVSNTLVQDLLAASRWEGALNENLMKLLLMNLVYNPGLRLKSQGYATADIMAHLHPVISQISELALPSIPEGQRHLAHNTFERQVFVNLFSPFIEDMAFLDASEDELSGHPGLGFDDVPDLLKETYQGPLAALGFSASPMIQRGFERLGLPIDIDKVLAGTLDGFYPARALLLEVGRSAKTDSLLENLLVNGPSVLEDHGEILSALNYDLQTMRGKAGLLALNVLSTTMYRDSAKQAGDTSGDWATFYMSVSEKIKEAPSLGPIVLEYLETHELLDPEIVRWCGFQSDILYKLKGLVPGDLSESMMCEDLGL